MEQSMPTIVEQQEAQVEQNFAVVLVTVGQIAGGERGDEIVGAEDRPELHHLDIHLRKVGLVEPEGRAIGETQ